MFVSCLMINVGDNPDRQDWRNRNWLRNVYRVHQRLAMAFPSDSKRTDIADMLKPYNPADYPDQGAADEMMEGKLDVHEERGDAGGFLFRIDYGVRRDYSGGQTPAVATADPLSSRPVILVQSARWPNWGYAFGLDPNARDPSTGRPVGNAGYLLAAPPETKPLNVAIEPGQLYRFRLNANPTRRVSNGPFKGKRVAVGQGKAAVLDWLWRKALDGGFELVFERDDTDWDARWRVETGLLHAWKGKEDAAERKVMSFAFANIDGILRITDPVAFRQTLIRGIGPAKAFGFGLLSIAPVRV